MDANNGKQSPMQNFLFRKESYPWTIGSKKETSFIEKISKVIEVIQKIYDSIEAEHKDLIEELNRLLNDIIFGGSVELPEIIHEFKN